MENIQLPRSYVVLRGKGDPIAVADGGLGFDAKGGVCSTAESESGDPGSDKQGCGAVSYVSFANYWQRNLKFRRDGPRIKLRCASTVGDTMQPLTSKDPGESSNKRM